MAKDRLLNKVSNQKMVDDRKPGTQCRDGSWTQQKIVREPNSNGRIVILLFILFIVFACLAAGMAV